MLTVVTSTIIIDSALIRTIESVKNQINPGITHIIKYASGDCSSSKRAQLLSINRDLQIHCIPDQGLYDGLNQSMTFVKSEYFMFLHSGDTFVDEYSATKIIDAIKANFPDVLFGGVQITKNRRIIRKFPSKIASERSLLAWNLPPHTGAVYRKTSIDLWYDASYRIAADTKYLLSLNDLDLTFVRHEECLVSMITGGASNGSIKKFLLKFYEDIRAFRETNHKVIYVLIKKISKIRQLRILRSQTPPH